MIDVLDAKELYLSHFNAAWKQNGANGDESLRDVRMAAMDRFAELGFPSRRSEAWRYLDLRALEATPMLPASAVRAIGGVPARELLAGVGLSETAYRLVLVDGHYAPAERDSLQLHLHRRQVMLCPFEQFPTMRIGRVEVFPARKVVARDDAATAILFDV